MSVQVHCLQVPIPQPLCAYMVLLATADVILCFSWERMLRNLLPATRPPVKGYMAHMKALGQTADSVLQELGHESAPADLDKLE